jgi:hypothetical protein
MNVDGNAFDFDAGCEECVMEYCYGHDVDGACCLLWNDDAGATHSSNCVVRDCIFVNGSRGASSNLAAGLATAGDVRTPSIYHNIFWNQFNPGGVNKLITCQRGSPAISLYNNVFSISGPTMTFGDVGAAAANAIAGNVYNVRSGASFSLVTSTGTYNSLAALRAAGYEMRDGAPVGAEGDPDFAAPGTTPVIMPSAPVNTLSAYVISQHSAARAVGVTLPPLAPVEEPSSSPTVTTGAPVDAGPRGFGAQASLAPR